MTSVPVSPPVMLGEKVTVMPQEEAGASWLPQLLTVVKSALPVELETEVPIPVSGTPPLLVMVTVSGGEVWAPPRWRQS